MAFCPRCDTENPDDANVCSNCGSPMSSGTMVMSGSNVPKPKVFIRVVRADGGPESVVSMRGDVLVCGWGGTYGALRQATEALRARGKRVTHVHLRWLNPLNPRLDKLIHNFKHVLVPELNTGQLRLILRARYLVDAHGRSIVVPSAPVSAHRLRALLRRACSAGRTPRRRPGT